VELNPAACCVHNTFREGCCPRWMLADSTRSSGLFEPSDRPTVLGRDIEHSYHQLSAGVTLGLRGLLEPRLPPGFRTPRRPVRAAFSGDSWRLRPPARELVDFTRHAGPLTPCLVSKQLPKHLRTASTPSSIDVLPTHRLLMYLGGSPAPHRHRHDTSAESPNITKQSIS